MDDLLNIDNKYFNGLISQLHLNKANSSKTEAPFLDLYLSPLDRDKFISCKIYDKRNKFDFEIVNFPFTLKLMFLVGHPTMFIYRN